MNITLVNVILFLVFFLQQYLNAYMVKPFEPNRIHKSDLQNVNKLKLSDTSYQIVSFVFSFTVETFSGGEVRKIKNEGSNYNDQILQYLKFRLRPGTTLVIDSIVVTNQSGKLQLVNHVVRNIY
jgi:hypothetical protein